MSYKLICCNACLHHKNVGPGYYQPRSTPVLSANVCATWSSVSDTPCIPMRSVVLWRSIKSDASPHPHKKRAGWRPALLRLFLWDQGPPGRGYDKGDCSTFRGLVARGGAEGDGRRCKFRRCAGGMRCFLWHDGPRKPGVLDVMIYGSGQNVGPGRHRAGAPPVNAARP
jgi:hypothetical protein